MAKPEEEKKASGQGRAVMIKHPDSGKEVRRIDYIREAFGVGNTSRGDISRKLSVAYQIIFAGTKGMTQGTKYVEPPKPVKEEKKEDTPSKDNVSKIGG